MITDETVERVRESADIVQIIGEHVSLKRVGASWRGPCPFHQGTHRNFSVDARKGIYHCFVCHESGDVFSFVQKRLGMDFPSAVKYIGERSGVAVEEVQRRREGPDPRQPYWDLNSAVADYCRQQLWDDSEGEDARNYLALRRVSRDVADRFGLGYAPRDAQAMRRFLNALGFSDERLLEGGILVRREEGGEPRPRWRHRLIFPIRDASGNHVGFGGRLLGPGEPKYLNSAESRVFSKARLLYGLHMAKHSIRRDDRVMIVEGYFDVVRLVSAGFDWVVAPLGTALTEDQAALVRRYTKHAYLLYDSDRAGLKATFRAGDELLRHEFAVQVVTLPEGEDPDSFVDKHGAQGLTSQLGAAIDIFERKVQELQRRGYFADLRRKRMAIDALLPTIRAAADPMTRDIYLARAAEISGVSRAVLEREAGAAAGRRAERRGGAPEPRPELDAGREVSGTREAESRRAERRTGERRSMSAFSPLERSLIRILLHDRTQIERAAEQVDPDDLRSAPLRAIYRALLAAENDAPLDVIAAHLDADGVATLEMLQEEPIGDGFDAQSELRGCITRIRGAAIERRQAEIDRQMRIASEKEQDVLIAEKERLQEELQALGVGKFKGFRIARKH